ncbi:MAG: O-antigen ligase family protein [Aequorivita sp.]
MFHKNTISYLFRNIKPLYAILFHIGLGVLASISRPAMLIYSFAVIVYFSWQIITQKNKLFYVLIGAAYFMSAEVFFRMTKAYVFWETGKYVVIWFSLLGMFHYGFKRSAVPYIIYILLLLPGVLITLDDIAYDVNFRKAVLFNLSGPICLSVAAIFTYGRTVTFQEMLKIMDYIIYPIIAMTVYIVVDSPDIQEAVTGTASNSAVSGGYGPNQVATVLGLGVFLLLTRLLIPYKNILVHWTMMFFMALMAYRALLTFSRGGIVVAVLMCLTFVGVFYFATRFKLSVKTSVRVIALIVTGLAVWTFTVFQTGGMLENRYENKDALGRQKDDITTGRGELLVTEIEAFKEHPFFGMGVGRVKSVFKDELGIDLPTHNEVSRMLSEHGVFGLIALIVLIFAPIITKFNGRKNIFFWPFLIFWFLTIAHSSMRIAMPAFIYALCLLNIDYESKKKTVIHRK